MARSHRKFQRPLGKRRYRKMYVIATEGTETEPQYFDQFNSENATIHIRCLKKRGRGRDPEKVLKEIKRYLKEEGIKKNDEAWVVVDKDRWTDAQLDKLHRWSTSSAGNYGLAVSNPKFEYWLLLHFEDGSGVNSSRECDERLLRAHPNYKKNNIGFNKLKPGILEAIRRARQKDSPPSPKWPPMTGTTVYRLVEKLHP